MDNKVIVQDVTLAATINSYLKKDNVHNFTFTEDELKSYFSTTKELVINSRSAFDEYSEFFKYYSSLEKIQINLTGHSYEDDKFASEKIINVDWIKNNKNLKELIVNGVNFEELDLTDLKKLETISIKHAQGLRKIDYSTENLFELTLLDTNLQKVPHFEVIKDIDIKLDINLLPILKRDYKNLYEYMSTFSNDKIWMEPKGKGYQSFSNGKILMYDKKVDEIISSVTTEKMNDLQKMAAIYDYIIKNVYYDHKTLYAQEQKTNPFDIDPSFGVSISGMTTKEAYDYKQSGVKALLDRTSVCEGYANLYTYFLRKLGIESNCVTVKIEIANGYHAITRVKYNDNYYYFDPTWDATVDKNGKIKDCNVRYFMLNKEEMSKDHSFVCEGENDLPNKEFSLNEQMDRLNLINLVEKNDEELNDKFLKIIDQLTGEYVGYEKIPNGRNRFNDTNRLMEQYRKILGKLDESSDELSFKNSLELKKALLKEENRLQNEIMKTQSNNSSFHV